MSFWETTREDKDTVTDAIAFIDSFEANVDETEHNGVSVQESSSSSQTRRKTVSGDLKPKRKKKPNPRREQSNANALSCRVCVMTGQELSALAALSQAQWKALVEYERDARRQSEETNRRLKQILAHQLDTNKNLRCTLQKQSLLQGIDFVFCNTPTSTYSFTAFENSTAIVNHLESVRIKFDKERGKVAEMKATTSVAGPMEEAAKLVWVEQNGQRPDPQKWARRMRGRKPNSQEKNWILTLTCQSYVKHVKGIQLLQKFEEPNRIVLVRTDLMTLTTEGLQFRDKCLTIITRSNTDPLHASVVRIYEEIYMDPQRGFSARPEDMVYAQNVVLKTLSWKLHECSHRLQDMLVCKFQ
ncbi:hypothetical protein PC129_g11932 [Phytophthora cactorum]|uniref:Uncharacterized protein n=1 Tax=Phytophthora cactorum TaxID=29920 RepID=A0A8T1HYW1_9STRA|nr:hypothetical protein Pcac1_g1149 [Phytophthora cactorum]KAG2824222.1 hypothetical protein PC111_g9901 [Phytophthora cactorum]KAG2853636.1 hypothetical protein PC113_g14001 [Phytophthora cactorum]KAG2896914.1 hypothetical protein PC114_g14879 [Phytophthora cactorum]KAG2910233.1 hypothetical protein PC115_g12947 [Phytophthora cactorum]